MTQPLRKLSRSPKAHQKPSRYGQNNDQYVSTKDSFTNEDAMLLINLVRKTTSWKAGSVKITTNTETEKRGTMTNNGRDSMKNRASNGTLNDTPPRILKKGGMTKV